MWSQKNYIFFLVFWPIRSESIKNFLTKKIYIYIYFFSLIPGLDSERRVDLSVPGWLRAQHHLPTKSTCSFQNPKRSSINNPKKFRAFGAKNHVLQKKASFTENPVKKPAFTEISDPPPPSLYTTLVPAFSVKDPL